MDLHGGSISASSAGLGRGSTFTVDIVTRISPSRSASLAPGHEDLDTTTAGAVASGSKRIRPSRSMLVSPLRTRERIIPLPRNDEHTSAVRISFPNLVTVSGTPPVTLPTALIVDDSKLNRKMLCRSLREHFLILQDVESGMEAVEFVTNQ
eukprot:gene5068-6454_t